MGSIRPEFRGVEASRPKWRQDAQWQFTQTADPGWMPGDGANDGGAWKDHKHIDIAPYENGRAAILNYKLLVSTFIPRPIAFVSTRSKDGSTTNLAPFSYAQMMTHDPPLFVIGFTGGFATSKDTLKNLLESQECTINIVSEHFLEAANAAGTVAPYGVSEWAFTGLTPAPSKDVKADRVAEAIFSIEGKLVDAKEVDSRANPGQKSASLVTIEGVRFWAREDAINKDKSFLDPNILRPMARLGGITYGRILEAIELPRPEWKTFEQDVKEAGLYKSKLDSQ
ncbi:uncharacterized protein Z520_05796 [Fonsecaea multimorphosa CBS 102226]|uniref:Flavin reductase like domain-containing protein n=1 Tax=Fonsecaea multimorphosa CBS 102226 TaxID=1442371 RepID=A0A0D2H9G7_9EURO|nr:uncharacterized protein Z520_05796 [Fonsecaea multimorphosa CBS 102226]KIX98495.1 hypothetical protein Z520_05796 [Fonsecaea multimorphosa CBS 102226]OAL24690.1 hypothetical protein AYO22_05479 [Fonsecaea multimorphosa]